MMKDTSRRTILKKGGAAGAAATVGASSLVSGCVGDVAGGGGLKIGVIQPYSGDQPWGTKSTWGFLSGLGRVYGEDLTFRPESSWAAGETLTFEPGDGDRTYEFLFRDTVFEPQNAEAAAEAFVLDENVDVLFGVATSSGTLRVIENVAKPTDTLYITGGASTMDMLEDPDLCGRKIFRANEHTGMEARAMGKYIDEETSIETMYLLGVDDPYGLSFTREYRKVLTERGIEVVGERHLPAGFGSFREVFTDIDDQAEGVALGFSIRTINNVLSTFAEGNVSGTFDLRGYGPLPGSLGVSLMSGVRNALDEVTAESIKQEAGIGALTSRYHWNQYDNPINEEFVSGFVDSYGTVPALFAGGTYAAGSAVAQAVEETGSQDPNDVADAMYGMTVEETPKGEDGYVFQEHNNQAKSPMTVARIVPNDEGRWEDPLGTDDWNAPIMPGEPVARVSADEAALPTDDQDMECDLR